MAHQTQYILHASSSSIGLGWIGGSQLSLTLRHLGLTRGTRQGVRDPPLSPLLYAPVRLRVRVRGRVHAPVRVRVGVRGKVHAPVREVGEARDGHTHQHGDRRTRTHGRGRGMDVSVGIDL